VSGLPSGSSHLLNLCRNIMRDNMLVNVSGIPGHAMGMDLNIEHLIRYLKVQIGLILSYKH